MEIIVPALSARTSSGALNHPAARSYIARAAETWFDRFIISGSTDSGHMLTNEQRATLLDLWLSATPPSRLVACCWTAYDIHAANERGVAVLATAHSHNTQQLTDFPPHVLAYSHPEHSPIEITVDTVQTAHTAGTLVRGAKVSKRSVHDLWSLRQITGPDFSLWDGSSRRLAQSHRAGVAGVVCAPLAALPDPLPQRQGLADLQAYIDPLNEKFARDPRGKLSGLRALAFH